MKIGLDYHGVVSNYGEFFSTISALLVEAGHEVHILTGLSWKDFIKKNMADTNTVTYTTFFSITDCLESSGGAVGYDDSDRPHFKKKEWDTAKAKYCEENNIDLMIDDSKIYGKYFTTPYIQVKGIK